MKRIILLRHCKANGQEPSAELTEEGIVQSRMLIEFLSDRKIDFICSSPFDRAIATIRPLSEHRKLAIHIDERLSERVLSSEDRADWLDRLKDSFTDLDLKLPSGESSREAMNRGSSVIGELFQRAEDNIVVVTHGNLLSLILKCYDPGIGFDDWRGLTNPDVYELSRSENADEVRVRRLWK